MSERNFKLNYDDNGKVHYIIKAGKDLSMAIATREQAEWMMNNKPITRGTPTDWPDFCVCAGGDYWFDGTWEDEPEPSSIFEETDSKPRNARRLKDRKRGD